MKIERNVSLEELEAFIIFKVYYQIACCTIHDKEMMKLINKVMDHHYNIVYGPEYSPTKDIKDYDFKCI